MKKMKKMVKAVQVGEAVIISGVLVENKDGKFTLNPAIQRDPKIPFKP
jgi:preprotein translocase subunit YajC